MPFVRDDPTERLAYFRAHCYPGTEVLEAWESSQPWHAYHERYAICACLRAGAEWIYRGRKWGLNDRECMLLEPGETHRNTVVYKPAEFKVFFLPKDMVSILAQELGIPSTPHFMTALTGDPALFARIYRFCETVERDESELAQQSALLDCLHFGFKYMEKPPRPLKARGCGAAVLRAKKYLDENFDRAVTLEDLSAVAGLSKWHLIHAFRKMTGLPPHAYQLHVRVSRAQTLLRQGLLATEVAARLGFADQSHFTRHFKGIVRVTPRQYSSAMR